MLSRACTVCSGLAGRVARGVCRRANAVAIVTALTVALLASPVFAEVIVPSCTGVADGALCEDDNPCTVNDTCRLGICVGVLAPDDSPCTDRNQCTIADKCIQGICVGTVAADGLPCSDLDSCTENDSCGGGVCRPGPARSCDDGNVCTIDQCLSAVGCVITPIPMCTPPEPPPERPVVEPSGRDASVDVDDAAPQPTDGPTDGPVVDAPTADAGRDGPEAPPGDASVAPDAGVTPVRYTIEGGACVCTTSRHAGAPPPWLWIAAVVIGVRRRRRGKR